MSHPYGVALAALLRLHAPRGSEPGWLPADVDRRVEVTAEEAGAAGVEAADVIALCVVESGLRLRARRASLCGCGPSPTGDRAQARCAATAWAAGLARCGSPEGAMNRYVRGTCGAPRRATAGPVEWRSHLERYHALWSRIVSRLHAAEAAARPPSP